MSLANPLNLGTLKQGCWKRKGSEEDGEDSNSRVKKTKYSWYVTLESESPQPTSSDENESIYSVQEQETEYVQDTSDTSTNTWVTSGDDLTRIEYEPVSLSADENPFIDCLTSSDPELSQEIAGFVGYATIAAIYDSDVDLADDSDDSLTSRDSEISHADYWTCVQCNNSNNNPLFRMCEKCYQERKLFLPPRPRGRRRKKASKKKTSGVRTLEGQESLVSQDSGLGSSLGSQSSISFDLKRMEIEKSSNSTTPGESLPDTKSLSQNSLETIFENSFSQQTSNSLSQPSSSTSLQEENSTIITKTNDQTENLKNDNLLKYGSQESQNSTATTVAVSEKNCDLSDSSQEIDVAKKMQLVSNNSDSQSNDDKKFCIVCTVEPKNSGLVHGSSIHICFCYRCAMRVWKTTKHCPICKRKVSNVLKAYY